MTDPLHVKVPITTRRAEDVNLDANAEGVIKSARCEIDIVRVLLGRKRRTAGLAPSDGIGWPQFVSDPMVFSRQPSEVRSLDDDDGVARPTARLAAIGAVTHPHTVYLTVYLIGERTAQAASLPS